MKKAKAQKWKDEPEADEAQDAAATWVEKYGERFPLEALPTTAHAVAATVADVYQLPPEMPALCALATISGAMGATWRVTGGAKDGQSTNGNLYIVIGAPAGLGKGAATAIIAEPFVEYARDQEQHFMTTIAPGLRAKATYAETLLSNKRKEITRRKREEAEAYADLDREDLAQLHASVAEANRLLTPPTPYLEDVTSQKLAMVCDRNPDAAAFLMSAEAAEVLRIFAGRYRADGKGDFDIYLKGFSVEPMRQDRVTRDGVFIRPCLSMLLLVQPIILAELYGSEEALERGFCARLIAANCDIALEEDDGTLRELDKSALQEWSDTIARICDKRPTETGKPAREITYSAEAREIFRGFHNEIIRLRKAVPEINKHLARWRELAIRIGANIAVGETAGDPPREIGAEIATRAVTISRWAVASQLRILRHGRGEYLMGRMDRLRKILMRKNGGITLREADKSHGFPAEEVRSLCAFAPGILRIDEIQNENGGRPSTVVSLT